jgi:5-keto 4-deoxyuronate isomerase
MGRIRQTRHAEGRGPVTLGTPKDANQRAIHKYIHLNGVKVASW